MNHLLRYSGHDAAEAFNRRLIGRMRDASDVRMPPPANVRDYLQEDDE